MQGVKTQTVDAGPDAELTHRIIGAAIIVHRELGPGLLESAYEACLVHECTKAGLTFQRQAPLPVRYDSILLDCGYRADLIVESRVFVELKSIDELAPIHESQLLTYLKLTGLKTGLLINFNVRLLTDGIKRRVL